MSVSAVRGAARDARTAPGTEGRRVPRHPGDLRPTTMHRPRHRVTGTVERRGLVDGVVATLVHGARPERGSGAPLGRRRRQRRRQRRGRRQRPPRSKSSPAGERLRRPAPGRRLRDDRPPPPRRGGAPSSRLTPTESEKLRHPRSSLAAVAKVGAQHRSRPGWPQYRPSFRRRRSSTNGQRRPSSPHRSQARPSLSRSMRR